MSGWQAGEYKATITGASCSATTKGTPQMVIDLDVGGHKKQARLYFSDKAQEQSMNKLREIGFNGNFEDPKFTEEEITVTLKQEEYLGKPQERWELPWPSAPAVEKSTMMSLGAMFKATAAPPPPPPPPSAPPSGNRAPPPPKAPPANAPPPSQKQEKPATATRDEAWSNCVKVATATKADPNAMWVEALDKIETETGRKEVAFTPQDWAAVIATWLPF